MAEIEEAARAVRAHEFISELPGGYEAPVNEAGTNLSVGQKQLLSFARILLMDPAHSHPGRGHGAHRHQDRAPAAGGHPPDPGGKDVLRHRPPSFHD